MNELLTVKDIQQQAQEVLSKMCECAQIVNEGAQYVFKSSQEVSKFRQDLKDAECRILIETDPKELGTNEAQRSAKIAALTSHLKKPLDEAEEILAETRSVVDAAKTVLDMKRREYDVLRLIADCALFTEGSELQKGVSENG
jgi:hypothetical protein